MRFEASIEGRKDCQSSVRENLGAQGRGGVRGGISVGKAGGVLRTPLRV